MDVPRKPRSPRTARIKAAKALKKLPTALLLKKKAECDAKALKIVEQMIEPGIEVDWLLKNLGQINKSHMDDIAEERSIVKLCGYPLCDNPLKKVVRRQYQISTLRNKVYDIARVKNFCGYRCYAAMEYLMEQMLTSPLWVREDEEIPNFQILPRTQLQSTGPPGVEVDLTGIKLPDDTDEPEEPAKNENEEKGTRSTSFEAKKFKTNEHEEKDNEKSDGSGNEKLGNKSEASERRIYDGTTSEERASVGAGSKMENNTQLNCLISAVSELEIGKPNENSSGIENEERIVKTEVDERLMDIEMIVDGPEKDIHKKIASNDNQLPDSSHKKSRARFSSNIIEDPNETHETLPKNSKSMVSQPIDKASTENRKSERRKSRESKTRSTTSATLTERVETSLVQWITEETMILLYGDETERRKIFEGVYRQEKYAVLCKKLNNLQLEEERETMDRIGDLKPAPEFSALREEAKKLDLKVRAFFQGQMVIDPSADKPADTAKQDEKESETTLPLLDLHAPKALRRRIFLDKLNRVLMDLLRALAGTGQSSSTRYSYTSERRAAVKALVTTFSLSATNITFKTAEWTLVALIIIKLLSFMDPVIKDLLTSERGSMYTSMILMSYKLDSNYLETLIVTAASPSNTVTTTEDS